MKATLLKLTFLLLLGFTAAKGTGQAFTATYNFSSVTTTSGRTDPTSLPTAAGIACDSFRAVGALSANSGAAARFSFSQWPTGATNGSNTFTGLLDTTRYYEVKLTPLTGYQVSINTINFTVQRSATGIRQWAVRTSADGFARNIPASIEPANAAILLADSNKFQIADRATTTAQAGSKVTISNVQNSTSQVIFRFYGFNAEASTGTFSLNRVDIAGVSAASVGAPVININPVSLSFPATAVSGSSQPKTFTVRGDNLTAPLVITSSASFLVSLDNVTYSTTLSIPAASAATDKIIYAKFSPASATTFNGTITNSSSGAASKTVTVTGDGIDPAILTFNFNSCSSLGTPGSGFLSYSVNGAQKWACSAFGRNSTNGVDVNGYSGGPQENEDWLISPPLAIASLNLPILRFYSRGEFTGPSLQLLVSTNYDGSSDPNTATWTDLNANFPPLTNTWTITDGIDLSAYKTASKVYIAFKYISSVELGAARWTLDDIDVSNRTTLISATPTLLNFGEAAVGANTAALPFIVKATGYGNITVKAPAGYKVSADSIAFADSVTVTSAAAQAGAKLFARFSPTVKALKVEGSLRFTATGLDSMPVAVTGTSYPKAETFDAGCYNLSFFGSNSTNDPTPAKVNTQIANIATVLQRLNLDVTGVEEVSSDTAFANLLRRLPNRKAVISDRWSYSFNGPDPAFPPQKTGFLYDTTTTKLVSVRDMFLTLYDSARTTNPEKLPNYPGGTPSSFWASGRLPFMATFDVTLGGITKRIRVIDIHAKSASDVASFNRRLYDEKVLKDTLDAYYPNDNIVLVGDFNDRLSGSIYTGSATSSYKPFVDDTTNYAALTYPLDVAGRVSFVTGTGMIDHVVTSNELKPFYIANSADIEDPRSYISGYGATTASDHLPVYTRFSFTNTTLPVTLTRFNAVANGADVLVTWTTATEVNNSYFVIERSADGRTFNAIATQTGAGNTTSLTNYRFVDQQPLPATGFYRLRQVDADGKATLSNIVAVNFAAAANTVLNVYPNPVTSSIQIMLNSTVRDFTAQVTTAQGSSVIVAKGDINQINRQINQRLGGLASGVYVLTLSNSSEKHVLKFVKQ